MKDFAEKFEIYGIGKIGTKGQLVIPAEARRALNFTPGEKVVVAGFTQEKMVIVMNYEAFERHIEHMSKHHDMMAEMVKNSRKLFGKGKLGD
ncbi:MAG: AbrB/MazE/SpoVT family DNA-binding domain-containing protein [Candidatus Nomurabacteria bacterium]|jgi:AbrB family looped-hinge helix DNA binding protein|nr:AbrB/MazE/SpoVT family DNA-binding domain-containing protein [Candidatus Nomurabacteria bacterium]